ncbi:hypothetical protein ACFZBU_02170 [Embleya sp. NPDC008237]|uniref:hypothetical protein n=1 Tax=Embleya sp. NPDC008237 TaxID=3363978 RepID=UPI0036E41BA4
MSEHKHEDILIDRLRELAGGAETAATLAAPERVRTRGTRRRNRIRITGAGALTACVVAGGVWVSQPDEARQERMGTAAGMPSGVPSGVTAPPDGTERIGLMNASYLPTAAGVEWSTRTGMPLMQSLDTQAKLFGPCASTSLQYAGGATLSQHATAAGSHVKTLVTSTYFSNVSPRTTEANAQQIYASWQVAAASCLTHVPSNVPGTDVWSWTGDGKRGTVVTTIRGHVLGWIATEMVAADPEYPLTAEVGPALMDEAILTEDPFPSGTTPLPEATGRTSEK